MIARTPLPARPPADLTDLRVLLFGLGTFGGGLGAVRFFQERGARVWITDLRDEEQLACSLAQLDTGGLAGLTLGEHRDDDFMWAEWVVVNPGIAPGNRYLDLATAAGKRLVTEMGLFLRWCPSRHVAAITGSNGKSTTTQLMHDMLYESGIPVRIAGNMGTSLLPEVEAIAPEERVVVELSSFQLERLDLDDDVPLPPAVAITHFAPNHLDWHGGEEGYRRAKERILLPARAGVDAVVALPLESPHMDAWRVHTTRRVVLFSGTQCPTSGVGVVDGVLRSNLPGLTGDLAPVAEMTLQGPANHGNAACAAALALSVGATPQGTGRALRNFHALLHRQEPVGAARGVRFVNDSKATTPDATACALEAYGPAVVLLLGGRSKGCPFRSLAAQVERDTHRVVIYGENADELEQELHGAGLDTTRVIRASNLDTAFHAATDLARPGDTVLLSPASASFDQFPNYEARGDRFRDLVHRWCDRGV